MHIGQSGDAVRALGDPVGMVPEDEGALISGLAEGNHRAVSQQLVGIADEDRVGMARRHLAGDLRAQHHNQVLTFRRLEGDLVAAVAIGMGDVFLMRLVFQMIGDRDRIQPVLQRLHHPDVGPDVAVGEYRMLVKIALQGAVAGDVGELDLAVVAVVVGGGGD